MIRKTVFLSIALCMVSLSLFACSDQEPAKRVDLSRREEITFQKDKREITYAYLPQYSHSVSYKRHHKLVEYLAQTTGLSFRQVFPDTFAEHMTMVEEGLIDISFSNPFIYVKIADRYGARAFARTEEEDQGTHFRGQIIVRADNPTIQEIKDVKGQHWIAVDPSSAGGYLFALGYFIDHGISKNDFAEIAFAPGPGGKQEKVVLGVYSGRYGVGSIREGALEIMRESIDTTRIKVLATTPWYPGWVYSARKGLDPDVVLKISQAMTSLSMDNPEEKDILRRAKIISILPAQDSDFNSIRELIRKTGVDAQ